MKDLLQFAFPMEPKVIAALVLAFILLLIGIYKIVSQYRQTAKARREVSHRLTVDFAAYKQKESEGRGWL